MAAYKDTLARDEVPQLSQQSWNRTRLTQTTGLRPSTRSTQGSVCQPSSSRQAHGGPTRHYTSLAPSLSVCFCVCLFVSVCLSSSVWLFACPGCSQYSKDRSILTGPKGPCLMLFLYVTVLEFEPLPRLSLCLSHFLSLSFYLSASVCTHLGLMFVCLFLCPSCMAVSFGPSVSVHQRHAFLSSCLCSSVSAFRWWETITPHSIYCPPLPVYSSLCLCVQLCLIVDLCYFQKHTKG